jgi:hypothetical protein
MFYLNVSFRDWFALTQDILAPYFDVLLCIIDFFHHYLQENLSRSFSFKDSCSFILISHIILLRLCSQVLKARSPLQRLSVFH